LAPASSFGRTTRHQDTRRPVPQSAIPKASLQSALTAIESGDIDPSFVITHRASLEQGPELYKTFRAKEDGCIKVVMKP
jgi:threonine dehydrogenase-like Zn-dependent dehydrogenase